MQKFIVIAFLFSSTLFYSQLQTLTDDFEGNGTILNWYGGDCGIDNHFLNPYPSVTLAIIRQNTPRSERTESYSK